MDCPGANCESAEGLRRVGVPGNVVGGGGVGVVETGFTSNVDTTKPLPMLPPIFEERGLATLFVVTTNDADVALAGTRTLADTVATVVSVLTSVTREPPVGAGPVSGIVAL